jgi:hypothetical protein
MSQYVKENIFEKSYFEAWILELKSAIYLIIYAECLKFLMAIDAVTRKGSVDANTLIFLLIMPMTNIKANSRPINPMAM